MKPAAAVLTRIFVFLTGLGVALLAAPLVAQNATEAPVAPTPPAFSATAVQILPDGTEQLGRIMKSGTNMRIEMQAGGGTSIQILRGAEGLAYLVDPQTRTYAVIRDPSVAHAVAGASDPCPSPAEMQSAQMTCEQVGQGNVSGIVTQTWELKSPQIQGAMRAEWDTGRRRALREEWPDGTTMTLTFQAMQEVGGRPTEYWQTALKRPDQPAVIGGWWFDPELLLVVREEVPGGITRVLKDIRVGPIDPAAFEPPQGYRQVEPRTAPQAAPQSGAGQ